MKKGDISIYLIFSILITLVGIGLVFAFIAKNTDSGRKMYCDTLYQKDGTDKFCEEYLDLKVTTLTKREETAEMFTSRRSTVFMELDGANSYSGTASFVIPRNARIKNASVDIGLAERKLMYFADGKKTEIMIFPKTRVRIDKELPIIPADSMLTRARVEVAGAEFPTKAQLVFVIDTSGSMMNEWQALCSVLDSATEKVLDIGLDLTTYVYGMDNGGTEGTCIQGRVSESQMREVGPLGPPPPLYGSGKYDQASEAWALASGWLADNFPEWNYDTDNKRIVIPIGDSDPTGGGPTQYDANGKPVGPGVFYGTEGTAVANAITLATQPPLEWVYMLPITGDEDYANAEGYGVGREPCTGVCSQVMAWMYQLADATGALSSGASIVNFKDSETIKEQIVKIMTTPFPSNIDLYIESTPIWHFAGQLNDTNSPQTVDGSAFVGALLSHGCIGKDPPCKIGVMSDEGTVILEKLAIRYVLTPFLGGAQMTVNGIINSRLEIPDYVQFTKENDLTEIVQQALADCPEDQKYCEITLEIVGSNDGFIELSNLMVEYDYFDLEEEILQKVLACWRKSNEGHIDKNLLCDEITIGEIYTYTYPITEEILTDMLISKNICHIFENSDLGCGGEDMLKFDQDLFGSDNILIEYRHEDRQVIVS